jgi:hypothetical protein
LSSARSQNLSHRFHRIRLKQSVVTNHRFLAKAAPRTHERLVYPQISPIPQISGRRQSYRLTSIRIIKTER